MQRILAIAWLTWKAALRFKLFLVIAVLVDRRGRRPAAGHQGRRHGAGFHADHPDLHVERHHGAARTFDALAGVRHAGARHRGMPDPGRRHQADGALADLAGQMAGHRDAERGVAGDFRRRVFMACCEWRATKLPAAEQKDLRTQVLVARGSAKEQVDAAEIDAETEQVLQERLKSSPVDNGGFAGSAQANPRAGEGRAATRAAELRAHLEN